MRTRSSSRYARPRSCPARIRPRAPPPRRTTSGLRLRRWSGCSSTLLEVREPELHERADRFLEPRLARSLERLLVALPHPGWIDTMLQSVVAGDEELLDPLPSSL